MRPQRPAVPQAGLKTNSREAAALHRPQYPITELLTHRFPLATIAPGRHSVWDPSNLPHIF